MDEYYRVRLTTAEALAVVAAARALDPLITDGSLDAGLEPGLLASAAERIEAELPDFTVGRTRFLADVLRTELREYAGDAAGDEWQGESPPFPTGRTRRLLDDAARRLLPVEIEYYVVSRKEWTVREVDISAVSEQQGVWYLTGHDHLRDDFRRFRLDHIRSVRLLEERGDDPFVDE